MNLPHLRASILPLLVVFAFAACGDAASTSKATRPDAGTEDTTPPPDADATDTAILDTSTRPDAPTGAGLGEPCRLDEDCESLLCIIFVPGQPGVCGSNCQSTSDCPEGSECVVLAGTGADAQRVGLPRDLCFDADDDGFGVGPDCRGPDCDDTRSDVNPFADELCDGLDNDCDGVIDDNPVGVGDDCDSPLPGRCLLGRATCVSGEVICTPRLTAIPEVCDGVDNDCDGDTDEDDNGEPLTEACWGGDPTRRGVGVCDDGIARCQNGRFGACFDQVLPADEICDGLDNDCDGEIDEGIVTGAWWPDADGDGFGDASAEPYTGCAPPEGWVTNDDDCDDDDDLIHPDANEGVGDGIDQDCDGLERCWPDLDNDGFRPAGEATVLTSDLLCAGDGVAPDDAPTGDCRDDLPDANPDGVEICDLVDDDCDGDTDEDAGDASTFFRDDDGDLRGNPDVSRTACAATSGWVPNADDCDDNDPATFLGATEIPGDGKDQSCDGLELCFIDADNDGVRTATTTLVPDVACAGPGLALDSEPSGDCNDDNPDIRPGATELLADGIDQNCDNLERCLQDLDGDGFHAGIEVLAPALDCVGTGIGGNEKQPGDCNDNNRDIRPGAFEATGDGVDSNCDGLETCYLDRDRDGYRTDEPEATPIIGCDSDRFALAAAPSGDCNDNNRDVNPGATEVCNGIDDNCRNGIDEGVRLTFWRDADNDGYGNPADSTQACTAPAGYVNNAGDCNDAIQQIHPGATEVCDGWDNDCSGGDGNCPSGCTGHASNNRGYMLCRIGGHSRTTAQNSCNGQGMDLVQIDDQTENDFLYNSANNRFGGSWGHIWIGINDIAVEGQYRWQNGTLATYQYWNSGEPNNWGGNEDCADMTRGGAGRWNDVGCSNNRDEHWCEWR